MNIYLVVCIWLHLWSHPCGLEHLFDQLHTVEYSLSFFVLYQQVCPAHCLSGPEHPVHFYPKVLVDPSCPGLALMTLLDLELDRWGVEHLATHMLLCLGPLVATACSRTVAWGTAKFRAFFLFVRSIVLVFVFTTRGC